MTRREPKAPPTAAAVDAADAALFRDAIGSVRHLTSELAERRATPPAPIPHQSHADERAVAREMLSGSADDLEWSDPLHFVANGVSPGILRRLGRAEFSVRDEIDLHRMNVAAASATIAQFLAQSRKAGRLCVKIIHGKGLRSRGAGPVLKRLTDRMLRQRGDVLAFRSARPVDGGTGAVIILLRNL